MKSRKLYSMFSVIVVLGMLLAGCGSTAATTAAPAATDTAAPAAATDTVAPAATTAATTAATAAATTAAWTPLSLAATDCSYGGEIKSIEAPDANTVVFTLCQTDAAFPAKVAFGSNEILPKALLDSTGGDSAKISENPIGTGPLMLKEWVKGDHMTLVPNPNYWGDKPTISSMVFEWASDAAQRLLQLQAGTVDGIELVDTNSIDAVKKDTTLQYTPLVSTNTLYMGMNNTIKPFDNEKVRQAFAMAIDKASIVKNFFPEGSTVADQFLYPGLEPGYTTTGYTATAYDPTKAKQLLTDAGYDFSQTIKLSYRTATRGYIPNPDQTAQEIQAELKKIGVNVSLDVEDSGTLVGNSASGKLQMFLLGWGEDYPDATDWFDYHFGPAGLSFGKPYDDIVADIKAGDTGDSNDARQTAYDKLNAALQVEVPMVPIAHGSSGDAFKASVKNLIVGPYNINFPYLQTENGTFVWLQTGEPISLWFGDESDGETENPCLQIYQPLLKYKYGGTTTEPALATSYESNTDLTQYTFHLRQGVKFSDGSSFSAADVFATYTAMWDYKNPNHKGNTGTFEYWGGLFGAFLNAPAAKS